MRIGMMVDSYKPYISGITNYVEINKKYLESAGHEVFVFTFGDTGYKDTEPNIIRSPGLPLADTGFYLSLRYSRQAKRLLQSMDIVHVHHPFLSGRLALRYCRPAGIPIVFTNHTRYDLYAQTRLPNLPEDFSQRLIQSYFPDFCAEMDLVITPSKGIKKILQNYGVECQLEVIPNGINLSPFFNAIPFSRKLYKLSEHDLLLIYVGRIAPEKNLDFLLEAYAGISKTINNVRLLIVGGGQKEHEEDIMKKINKLTLQDKVTVTGKVPYSTIPSFLSMCNVFVSASTTETFGMSTVEAMASKLPAIAIDSPGPSDIIEDGKTGYISSNDIATFTAKLTYLCMNKKLINTMGEEAKNASARYDIQKTCDQVLEKYERLTQTKRHSKLNQEKHFSNILKRFLS